MAVLHKKIIYTRAVPLNCRLCLYNIAL